MKRSARHFLIAVGIVAAAFPAAVIATIILMPLWSWIEKTYGIESVGHSGPADWCYKSVFGLFAAVGLGVYFGVIRRRS